MRLYQHILTNNDCYREGGTRPPRGIMVHSTGANNPNLSRYVDAPELTPVSPRHWNQPNVGACVHAFIGKMPDGTVATYQTLPWDKVGWHSGSGSLGYKKNANNNGYIGFEICEDGLTDSRYFNAVYKEAVELCAYLCKTYSLDPMKIICHCEGHKMGIASNHADVMHWFPRHGKSMDTFRADVKKELEKVDPVDDPSKWAVPHIEWAKQNGVMDGTRPHDGVTRQEAATMLHNLYDLIQKEAR